MHALRSAALAACSALLAAACAGGESAGRTAAVRCPEPSIALLGTAVSRYVKSISPTPRRFVIPVGSGPDSLPEAGRQALQDAGPTYLYPSDTAKQRVVETQLLSRGDWPTLLVAYRGMREESDSAVVVRLGGRFVSGELDEQSAPTRSVRLACRGGAWTFDRAEDERSS